jgi:hypothetical protein
MRPLFSFLSRWRTSIDSWTVPHFLFGTVVALFALVWGIPDGVALAATVVLAVLWEIVEMRLRIRETRWNVMSDILAPLVAFLLTYWLVGRGIDAGQQQAFLVVAVVFTVLANLSAWRARSERDPDFTV